LQRSFQWIALVNHHSQEGIERFQGHGVHSANVSQW
jgi:hypothetical protein